MNFTVFTRFLVPINNRLNRWVSTEWPTASVRREWPIQHHLATGTTVRGQADFVIATGDDASVIDHKVVFGNEAAVIEAASGYAGQLAVYANALLSTGNFAKVDKWIHLPLAGLVVRVTT